MSVDAVAYANGQNNGWKIELQFLPRKLNFDSTRIDFGQLQKPFSLKNDYFAAKP